MSHAKTPSNEPWAPRAAQLARAGWSADRIAKQLAIEGVKGASRSTVGRWLTTNRGPVRSPRYVHRVAPSAPTKQTPAHVRAGLLDALGSAEEPETYAAALLRLMRHDDPTLDAQLAEGAGLVDALSAGPGHDYLWVLGTPQVGVGKKSADDRQLGIRATTVAADGEALPTLHVGPAAADAAGPP